MTWLNFLLTSLLFGPISFVRETEQALYFISTPSSPLYPVENDNITLQWTYSLDGALLDVVELYFAADSPSRPAKRVARYRRGGTTQVANDFQNRSVFSLTDSQSTVIIQYSQKSDSGTYELTVNPDDVNLAAIEDEVKISVKYAAKINYTTGNQTLNESDTLNPICVADGNPTPNTTWTRVSDNKAVSFPLIISGKQDEGGYRCNASNGVGSPDSRIVYVFVQNYHPVNTNVTTNLTDNTILVNETFSITCSAQANPPAKYRFYKGNEYINGADNNAVITTSVSERVKMVNYSCIPFNFYGNGTTKATAVTVHYAPGGAKLSLDPSNTTVLRKSPLKLTCQADASPEAQFNLYFNGILVKTNSSGIFNVTVMSDGTYTCVPTNKFGAGENTSVSVTAVEETSASVLPEATTIIDGNSLNLTCNASGKPEASIKWTMVGYAEDLSTDSRLTVNVSRQLAKKNMIQYQCTASNGVGTPATATVNVTVHYPAMFSDPKNVTVSVTVGQEVNLSCSGEGYPAPTIILTAIFINGSRRNRSSGDSNLTVAAESSFWFQCTVENYLEKRTKWFHLVLYVMEIEITMTIVNKGCGDNPEKNTKQLRESVTEILKERDIPVEKVESVTFRCGSVTGYFSLTFSQNVELEDVLTILMKAAVENKFGDLQVDPNSIQAISPERIPKTPTPTPTPTPSPTPTNDDEGHPVNMTLIVVLVVFAVILLSVTFAVVIYCFYKRRKCRKDPRVHSSRSEERPCSLSQNDYCQVNNGYAEAGPQSTEVANLDHPQGEEGAAAVPNYAVVVKSKKKDKKKEKKGAEMNPCEDEYAVVDKSKKKTKKNEPDATYAEVDLLKKSKKPKPGEVLYADLGEFHHMKKMPEISTSPKTLPPIKRPDPYAETQYADITQFLKGNPGDAGAEPPKDSTTTAVGKEESLAGNTGDGAEGTNETGF